MAKTLHVRFHMSRAVFSKLLFSYIIILVVTILLSAITYQEADRIVDKNCRELKLAMLNQAKGNIDDYMLQVDEISSELIFNPDIDTMLYQNPIEEGSPDIFNVYQISKNLQKNTVSSHYLKSSFYIFFKNSHIVFSREQTYNSFEYFYENVFHYRSVDYSTWYGSLFQGGFGRKLIPAKEVTLNGTPTTAVTYMYSLPFSNSSDSSLGVIAFVIEEKQLQDLLEKANIDGKGWIGILDEKGQVISQASSHPYYSAPLFSRFQDAQGIFYQEIDGKDMMVLYSKSAYNHWTYTAILPTSVILMDTRAIQRLAIGIVLLTLVLGVCISCVLAYWNTRPIKKVASVVREYVNGGGTVVPDNVNELDYIEGSIHHIIQDSRTLEDDLKKNILVLQNVFMDKLLRNGFQSEAEMQRLLLDAELDIKGELFEVMIVRGRPVGASASRPPEPNGLQLAVKEVLLEGGNGSYVADLGSFQFAVLFLFPTGEELANKLKITRAMDEIKKRLNGGYHMAVSFGIGRPSRELRGVHRSFAEGLRAMALCDELGDGEQAVWYESLKNTVSGYYYPLDIELRLINACKSGNRKEVQNAMQKIHGQNFGRRELPDRVKKLLFYNMQCTLMKLTRELHMAREMPAVPDETDWMQDSESAFAEIEKQFLSICRLVDGSKKSHNVRLRDDIVAFLVAHYADPNLGVEMISSHFRLSTSYFSQFFKEQIGETFSSYVENLRIREACLRIEREDMPMEELAGRVGYNSVYSFRRSFKKVVGVTPLVYKHSAGRDTVGG